MVLHVDGVHKSFGGQRALRGVDFELRAGEIHALLGANGAGKSTLIRVLAGLDRADHGTITVAGQSLGSHPTIGDAHAAGLRFVHQRLGLIDSMSVAENVALGAGYARGSGVGSRLIKMAETRRRVTRRLDELGIDLDADALVGDLTPAEKVLVATARALYDDAPVVVLDEVTASLPAPDVERLADDLRRVRDRGASIVFVTHRIEEVLALADVITVLAEGRRVATAEVSEVDHDTIVGWIVGEPPGAPEARPKALAALAPVLTARDLAASGGATVSIELRAGEVLGLTGLVGSGFDTLARWIGGVARPERGSIELGGAQLSLGQPEAFRVAGCEFVTGDRAESAFLELKVLENLFPGQRHLSGRWRRPGAERRRGRALIDRLDVRPGGCHDTDLGLLSGGNQQKVLLGRALHINPPVLVLVDPTAGVDVGARALLHGLVRAAADSGTAVLLASSDFDEIAAQADRAIILWRGEIVSEMCGHDITVDAMTRAAHRAPGVAA